MFTAGTRKAVPTLRGVFGNEKPKVDRDFVQENRASLRELERVTAEKAQQKIDAAQRQWQPPSRATTSQTRLPTKVKVQWNQGGPFKNQLKTVAHPPGRDVVISKTPQQGVSECPSCGAVRQPQITRSVQTEDILDEDYLHNALRKCGSDVHAVDYPNRGGRRSFGGNDVRDFDAHQEYQQNDDGQGNNYQSQQHGAHDVVCCTDEEDNHSTITVLYNRNREDYQGDDNEGMNLGIDNLSLGHQSGQHAMPGSPSKHSAHTLRSTYTQHSQQQQQQQQQQQLQERIDAYEQSHPPHASSRQSVRPSHHSQQQYNHEPESTVARSRQSTRSEQIKVSQHSRHSHHYRQSEQQHLQQQQYEMAEKQNQNGVNHLGQNEQQAMQQASDDDPNCPFGHYILNDHERLDALKNAETRFKILISELSQMPITSDTLRLRTRKQEIEDELKDLEENIRIFSKPKVYVKLDN